MTNPSSNDKTTGKTTPAAATAVAPRDIKADTKVMCSKDGALGVVDHMQGPVTVKLKKDDKGVHHYIPLSWVTRVDAAAVHLDRPGDQAMREWSTEAPAKA